MHMIVSAFTSFPSFSVGGKQLMNNAYSSHTTDLVERTVAFQISFV